jgi:hypothetical protein
MDRAAQSQGVAREYIAARLQLEAVKVERARVHMDPVRIDRAGGLHCGAVQFHAIGGDELEALHVGVFGINAHQGREEALGMWEAIVWRRERVHQEPCNVHFGYPDGLPGKRHDSQLARGVLDLDVRASVINDQPVDVQAIGERPGHALQLDVHRAKTPIKQGGRRLQTALGEGKVIQSGERHRQHQHEAPD